MSRRRKILIAIASIAVVLIAARVALPYAVKEVANDRLRHMKAYEGSVADIDIALWRGAYSLKGVRLDKRGARNSTAFFNGDRIDLSVDWRSLLRGSVAARAIFYDPQINLVEARTEQESELGKEVNWGEQLERLFPFEFDRIGVHDGTVTFRAPGIRTEDSLTATHIEGTITNLTNVVATGKEAFADFRADAAVLGDGAAKISGSVNPLASQPTVDVNVSVKGVKLPKVNPWLRQYIKADAEAGEFELYMEIATAEGRFEGYAKPVMRDANVYGSHDSKDNPLRKLWEGIVELAANVLENKSQDQVAARIPLKGTVKDPKASIPETLASVVRNAFVAAFARSLEGSVSIRDVKKHLSKYEPREGQDKKKEQQDRKEPPERFGPRTS
jgi:hypothetical protein